MRALLLLLLASVAFAGESTMPGERAALKSTCANSPPFFCVGGKPGGQTLTCGTQSGDGCTFNSTSHATKGKFTFGQFTVNESTNRIGRRLTSPTYDIDFVGNDGSQETWQGFSYGSNALGTYGGLRLFGGAARGTQANPVALNTNGSLGPDALLEVDGVGYDGTALTAVQASYIISVDGSGAWTTSSHPTQICEYTTPASSTTIAKQRCTRGDGTQEFTKTIAKYNNIATVSNGVPAEYAKIDTTGLTGNVGSALLYAVPAAGAGMYRISSLVVETTAASVSSTLPNVQIVYTDNDVGSGTVTIDATPVLGVAGIGQTGALTANTVGTTATGVIVINVKASTNINYLTTNYASSTAGMAYAVHVKLEAL